MVVRVAIAALSLLAIATPASAQQRLLPDGYRSDSAPQLAYDLGDLVFNRVPDYIALGYNLRGLTGYVPRYRNGRDVTPLRYDLENLVAVRRAPIASAEAALR